MSITRTIRKKPRRRFPAKYTTRRAIACTGLDLKWPANTRFLVKLAPKVISEKCKEIAERRASKGGVNHIPDATKMVSAADCPHSALDGCQCFKDGKLVKADVKGGDQS